jgi:hypothetical protein
MVRVLRESPGTIHSYSEFKTKFFSIVGARACLIKSIGGLEAVEGTLSAAEQTSGLEGQITAQTGLINSLSRRLGGVRTRALKPGRCTTRQCVSGVEKVIEPSALNAQIAQAKLVRERLQAGLAAVRGVLAGSESAQIKFFETLDAERAAFERTNQSILISGLRQSIKAIKSKPGFAPARSTPGFRRMNQRLSSLTNVRNRNAGTPASLATLFSAPAVPTDVARRRR